MKASELSELSGDVTEQATLVLTLIGRDSWSRPVYDCSGKLYVDVDPRKSRKPDICTKQGNCFDGEPCDQIPDCVNLVFVPCRDTWNF